MKNRIRSKDQIIKKISFVFYCNIIMKHSNTFFIVLFLILWSRFYHAKEAVNLEPMFGSLNFPVSTIFRYDCKATFYHV